MFALPGTCAKDAENLNGTRISEDHVNYDLDREMLDTAVKGL